VFYPPSPAYSECGGFNFSQILIVRNFRVGPAPNTKDTPHHYTSVGRLTWQRRGRWALRSTAKRYRSPPSFLSPPEVELPWLRRGIRFFLRLYRVYQNGPKYPIAHFAHVSYSRYTPYNVAIFLVKSVTPNALLEHDQFVWCLYAHTILTTT